MAELHVQPKQSKPWWLWVLLALAVIGILFYFMRDRSGTDRDRDDTLRDDRPGATTALVTPNPTWSGHTLPYCQA